jgi:hypothetical protein
MAHGLPLITNRYECFSDDRARFGASTVFPDWEIISEAKVTCKQIGEIILVIRVERRVQLSEFYSEP